MQQGMFGVRPAAVGLALRPYQQDIVDRLQQYMAQHPAGRVMIQAPTGGGKTELAAWLVSDQGPYYGQDCAFIVHRRELVGQTVRRFERYGLPVLAGSDTGSHAIRSAWKDKNAPQPPGVVVIGVESWRVRVEQGSVNTHCLLILDEAHTTGGNSRRQSLFAQHRGPVVALTATPDRMSDREDFTRLVQHMICGPQNRELMEAGWLAGYQLYGSQLAAMELARYQRHSGESDDHFAERVFQQSDILDGVFTETAIRMWEAHPMRREDSKTLAFGCSIDHISRLQALFASAGVSAVMLTGTMTPAERLEVMQDFARPNDDGGAAVLLNVNMVREGFDCPEADVLLCVRPTESIPLWRQMAGRVFRPKDDGRDALILDLADNWQRHGLPCEDMDWTIGGAERRKPGDEPAMVCQGVVELEPDGIYISRRANYCDRCRKQDGSDRHCDHLANTFTEGRQGPEGCGATVPPGKFECYCGAKFRKQCPAEPDGCGKERSVKQWTGRWRSHRPGACDECGRKEESVSAQLSPTGCSALAWRPTRKGNGEVLRLAPDPALYPGRQDAKFYPMIWVGYRAGRLRSCVFPPPQDDDPKPFRALNHRLENEVGKYHRSEEQGQREAVRILSDLYRTQGQAGAGLFGVACRVCGEQLHNPRFRTCFDCRTDMPEPVSHTPEPEPEPEPEPVAAGEPAPPPRSYDELLDRLEQAAAAYQSRPTAEQAHYCYVLCGAAAGQAAHDDDRQLCLDAGASWLQEWNNIALVC